MRIFTLILMFMWRGNPQIQAWVQEEFVLSVKRFIYKSACMYDQNFQHWMLRLCSWVLSASVERVVIFISGSSGSSGDLLLTETSHDLSTFIKKIYTFRQKHLSQERQVPEKYIKWTFSEFLDVDNHIQCFIDSQNKVVPILSLYLLSQLYVYTRIIFPHAQGITPITTYIEKLASIISRWLSCIGDQNAGSDTKR